MKCKNEHVRCVAYVPGKIWSRGLDLFMLTLYNNQVLFGKSKTSKEINNETNVEITIRNVIELLVIVRVTCAGTLCVCDTCVGTLWFRRNVWKPAVMLFLGMEPITISSFRKIV